MPYDRKLVLIQSRYYNVNGGKWEARFFQKGAEFPDTSVSVERQGVWAKPAGSGWDRAVFVAASWRFVELELHVTCMPDR